MKKVPTVSGWRRPDKKPSCGRGDHRHGHAMHLLPAGGEKESKAAARRWARGWARGWARKWARKLFNAIVVPTNRRVVVVL